MKVFFFFFFLRHLYVCTVTIAIAHNLVQHDRIEHIKVEKHFIKEKVENGVVCISYVPSTEQTVVNMLIYCNHQ